MKEYVIISKDKDIRIDTWLKLTYKEYSRNYIKKLIDDNMVLVNGHTIKSNYKIKLHDEIKLTIPEPVKLDVLPEKIDVNIIYEDKDLLVVDKPKGMVVHPAPGNTSSTLVNALLNHCKDQLSDINGIIRPGIVHRIDKDTSGVIVVAKNNFTHEKLSEMLKIHDIKRVYIALVYGIIKEDKGKIDMPLSRHSNDRKKIAVNTKNGRHAVTYFKVLERFKDTTLIEVTLETGRTHQIRVHMSHIGFPIVGDLVYQKKTHKYKIEGQVLHAKILGFVHPTLNKYMEFESKLPKYFEELLASLKHDCKP